MLTRNLGPYFRTSKISHTILPKDTVLRKASLVRVFACKALDVVKSGTFLFSFELRDLALAAVQGRCSCSSFSNAETTSWLGGRGASC
jgi:hypothetical protein